MLIGLVGFIGSGKGTIADTLVERNGFIKESFAKSVKDAVSVVFGWDRDLLEGDTAQSRAFREQPDAYWSKKLNREFSPRLAMQLMGTEAGRDVFHDEVWIHSLEKRILQNENANYVIADVRFPNEVRAIHAMGGKVVRIKRGQNPEWYETAYEVNTGKNLYGMAENYPEIHYSEWAWIGSHTDMTLDNSGELDRVPFTVDFMIDSLYNNHIEANEDIDYETV
jgi:hypothetical protein